MNMGNCNLSETNLSNWRGKPKYRCTTCDKFTHHPILHRWLAPLKQSECSTHSPEKKSLEFRCSYCGQHVDYESRGGESVEVVASCECIFGVFDAETGLPDEWSLEGPKVAKSNANTNHE